MNSSHCSKVLLPACFLTQARIEGAINARDLGMGSPFVFSEIGAVDSLGFMSRSAKRREQVWESLHVSSRTAQGRSFVHVTIGLAGLVICDLSPTMSCQWASVKLSRTVLPGHPSRATFASAPFAIHTL